MILILLAEHLSIQHVDPAHTTLHVAHLSGQRERHRVVSEFLDLFVELRHLC